MDFTDGIFGHSAVTVARSGLVKCRSCCSPHTAVLFIFIFLIFIYLFWLHRALVAARGIFIAACGLLSCSMYVGSSFLTRDRTQAPCTGSTESYPLDHQESPHTAVLI